MAKCSRSQGAAGSLGLAPSPHPTPSPIASVLHTQLSAQTPLHLSSHPTLLHPLVPHRSAPGFPHLLLPGLTACLLRAALHSHLAMVTSPYQPGHRPRHSGGPDLVSPPSPEQEGGFPAPLPAQPPAQPGAPPCGQHAETGECPAQGPAHRGGGWRGSPREAMLAPGALPPEQGRETASHLARSGPGLVAGGSTASCFPEGQSCGLSSHPVPLSWRPGGMDGAHKGVPAGWREKHPAQGGAGVGPGPSTCFLTGLSG